jgi:hypothetical protein
MPSVDIAITADTRAALYEPTVRDHLIVFSVSSV